MHYINNLPVILAAFSAIIVGIYGYINRFSNVATYKYMCIFLIAFFFIGFFIKKTVFEIQEELQEQNDKTLSDMGLLYDGDALAVGGANSGAGVIGSGPAAVDGKTGAAVVRTVMSQPQADETVGGSGGSGGTEQAYTEDTKDTESGEGGDLYGEAEDDAESEEQDAGWNDDGSGAGLPNEALYAESGSLTESGPDA